MRGVPEDDELEIVPVEDAPDRPPPRRSPIRLLLRTAGRHRRALLATAVVLALSATAYAFLAVRGLRALERHTRAALALRDEYDAYVADVHSRPSRSLRFLGPAADEQRITRATADYGARVAQLASRARAVLVLDPRLVRLRREAANLLEDEARRARVAGSGFLASYGVNQAALLVADGVEGWGLRPGRTPRPPPLEAVAALRRPIPLLDEPTATRLFLVVPEGVMEVDIDGGTVRRLDGDREGIGPWAPGNGFLGLIDFGEGLVVPTGSGGTMRTVGRYDEVLPDADDRSIVWFVTRRLDSGDRRPSLAHAVDRDGTRHSEVSIGDGPVAALSSRWLVQHASGDGSAFTVVDRRTGATVVPSRSAAFMALRGDRLYWSDGRRLLVRTLPGTGDRAVAPPRPGLEPARVALSRDGRRAAVVWVQGGDGLLEKAIVAVHDADSGRVVGIVREGEDGFPFPQWSARTDWLFVLESVHGTSAHVWGWREGLATARQLRIEGEFYGLGAF